MFSDYSSNTSTCAGQALSSAGGSGTANTAVPKTTPPKPTIAPTANNVVSTGSGNSGKDTNNRSNGGQTYSGRYSSNQNGQFEGEHQDTSTGCGDGIRIMW